jgi:hypothetical protein
VYVNINFLPLSVFPVTRSGSKYIPWKTVLNEDREKHGKRALNSLLFPWKN